MNNCGVGVSTFALPSLIIFSKVKHFCKKESKIYLLTLLKILICKIETKIASMPFSSPPFKRRKIPNSNPFFLIDPIYEFELAIQSIIFSLVYVCLYPQSSRNEITPPISRGIRYKHPCLCTLYRPET